MVVLLENIDLRQKNNSIYEKIKENTTQLKLCRKYNQMAYNFVLLVVGIRILQEKIFYKIQSINWLKARIAFLLRHDYVIF